MAKQFNQTLVIVTHDVEISEFATRIIKLRDGKIEKIENGRDHNYEEKHA